MSDYDYRRSLKAERSDELINTYLMRPLAGILVRWLYRTPITPNQVTGAAIIAGLIAAGFYAANAPGAAGLLVWLKDLLDSADGQLARAKNQFSRRGRFLDSIGDIIVTIAVFTAIGAALFRTTHDVSVVVLAVASAVGMTLRVSYHVFYHVSYLHMHDAYTGNRLIEEITEEDLRADPQTLTFQRIFLVLYGWQDRLMARLDAWCRGEIRNEFRERWYGDPIGIALSGFLGYGTELFLLMLASVANELRAYLIMNVVGMNLLLAASIAYRRWILRPRIMHAQRRGG